MSRVICSSLTGIDDLTIESNTASRALKPHEVRIDVHGCGVNYPDTLIVRGAYQFKPQVPFTPGGEVAGVVTETGASVTTVNVGQRVAAICLWGGFADEVIASADSIIPIPERMDFSVAAGFTITYGTTIHALRQRARLQPGETVLVLGAAGGVGLAAVELAGAMGATVIAAASTDEKLQVARDHGATHTINYSVDDLKATVKALTNGRGVDVVYDPVGGAFTEAAVRATAWGGRVLVVGFACGTIPKIKANLLLLKGCEAVGVFWGEFVKREPELAANNMEQLFHWYSDGTLKPHMHGVWPLERVHDALHALESRAIVGKVVLSPKLTPAK